MDARTVGGAVADGDGREVVGFWVASVAGAGVTAAVGSPALVAVVAGDAAADSSWSLCSLFLCFYAWNVKWLCYSIAFK